MSVKYMVIVLFATVIAITSCTAKEVRRLERLGQLEQFGVELEPDLWQPQSSPICSGHVCID
jgi:hypothetical protein